MECLYSPDFKIESKYILPANSEIRHLKALRISIGDKISFTNGLGLVAETYLSGTNPYKFEIINIIENFGESKNKTALALAILDDRERFEFALEKAIELGISEFFPLISKFSSKKTINIDRLINKSIAAIKQCKRAILPKVNLPVKIESIFEMAKEYKNLILCDEGGILPNKLEFGSSSLIIVGPEGGFDEHEKKIFLSDKRTIFWKLSERRLRSETAAISALAMVNVFS